MPTLHRSPHSTLYSDIRYAQLTYPRTGLYATVCTACNIEVLLQTGHNTLSYYYVVAATNVQQRLLSCTDSHPPVTKPVFLILICAVLYYIDTL